MSKHLSPLAQINRVFPFSLPIEELPFVTHHLVNCAKLCKRVLFGSIGQKGSLINKQVIIVARPRLGFGDLIAALNMGKLISSYNLRNKIFITIDPEEGTSDLTITNWFKFLKKNCNFPAYILKQQRLYKYLQKNRRRKIAFGIASVDEKPRFIPRRIPFYSFAEYGVRFDTRTEQSYTMGLEESAIGVFINQELKEFAEQPHDPRDKILFLDDDLKTLLKVDENYHITHRFYFGYSFSLLSQVEFVKQICEKERSMREDVDLLLICKESYRNLEKVVCESRFSRIEFIDDSSSIMLTGKSPNAIGVLRLFFKKELSHHAFLSCLKASEKLTMLTGDQSCLEGVICNKLIIYECLHHKKDFFKSLEEFATHHNLENVASFLKKRSILPEITWDKVLSTKAHPYDFDEELLDEELKQFSKYISDEKNISSFILPLIRHY